MKDQCTIENLDIQNLQQQYIPPNTKRLWLKNLKNLTNLEHVPTQIEVLVIESCGKLVNLRTLSCELANLKRMRIFYCYLFQIDFCPVTAEELEINGCDALKDISGIDLKNGKLKKLTINGYQIIPFENENLSIKNLAIKDCTMISRVFGKQFEEGKLKNIQISECKQLTSLLNLPKHVEELIIWFCDALKDLSGIDAENSNIKNICISYCKQLSSLSNLPKQVEELEIDDCYAIEDLNGIDVENGKMKKLSINGHNIFPFENKTLNIYNLAIKDCTMISRVFGKQFEERKLKKIYISECKLLTSFSNLPNQVEELEIYSCDALYDLCGIDIENGKLKKLTINGKEYISQEDETLYINRLAIKDCSMISRMFGRQFEDRELKNNQFSDCKQLESLSNLPRQIQQLGIICCDSLNDLIGIDVENNNVQKIYISTCNQLSSLSNIPMQTKELIIRNCELINESEIYSILETYKRNNVEFLTMLFCDDSKQRKIFVWNMFPKNYEYINSILNYYYDKISFLCIKSSPLIKDLKGIYQCDNISIENCVSFNSLNGVDILKTSISIRISDCLKFSSLKGVQVLNKIQQLDMHSNSITDVSPLENIINLTNLNMNDNSIEKINILKNLTNLQTLNISKNKIKDINQLNGFQQLTKLKMFNCSGNKFCQNEQILLYLAFILPVCIEQFFFGVEYNEKNQVELLKEFFETVKKEQNPFTSKFQLNAKEINVYKLSLNDAIKGSIDTYRPISSMLFKNSIIYKVYAQNQSQMMFMEIFNNSTILYQRVKQIIRLQHKNFIPITDTFTIQNDQYIVTIMPKCRNFKEAFNNNIPIETLKLFIIQVVEALDYLQNQQIATIYGNISSNHIMLLPDNDTYKAVVSVLSIEKKSVLSFKHWNYTNQNNKLITAATHSVWVKQFRSGSKTL